MNALELVNFVLTNIDYPGGTLASINDDVLGTKALEWVNTAIEEIFNSGNTWSWAEQLGTITLVADQDKYSFASTVDLDTIKNMNNQDDGRPLDFLLYWEWERRRERLAILDTSTSSTSDGPVLYTIVNQQLKVWPTPTGGSILEFFHQALPDVLVADTDTTLIPAKHHRGIVGQLALTYAKLYLGDSDLRTQAQIQNNLLKRLQSTNARYREATRGMYPDRDFFEESQTNGSI